MRTNIQGIGATSTVTASDRPRGRVGQWLVLLAALLLTMAASLVPGTPAAAQVAACEASGPTLSAAKEAYEEACTEPRVDCDPTGDGWLCSSERIGNDAPGGGTPPPPEPPADGPCEATGPTLSAARQAYAQSCDEPVADCDPVGAGWLCSSEQIGDSGPGTPPPPPNPDPDGESCIALEAESLPLTGDWNRRSDAAASGGRYITWEGLSTEQNNSSPDDVIDVELDISRPGSYRFVWAMRQPRDVESDKANDSWLDFPDADRFGPVGGGSYGGFVKVFGNGKGDFAYAATADEPNHDKSQIAIEFDDPGTYTMQLAGRSHGHQIDRIIVHHDSISRADAIAGDCGGGDGGDPPPDPDTGLFEDGDLVSLQYDHAPDRDDGHATVCGRVVTDTLDLDRWVVGGAYGENAGLYDEASEPVMDATWGSDWIDAHDDWPAAVRRTADRWQQVLAAGGDVWVAEGGQSDLSADVVRELQQRVPGLDAERRIHVVQHSTWNEQQTTDGDLAFVRAETDYVRLEDGNSDNATADLNERTSGFEEQATSSRWGTAWEAAFDYLDPDERLDFSDCVELFHIVGIGKDRVADPADFADQFLD